MNFSLKNPVANIDLKSDFMMKVYLFASLLVLAVVTQALANAGTDNTFGDLVTWLEDQLDGSFGKGVAIASVVVGAVGALKTKDLYFLGYGVAIAVGLIYVPTIIGSFFSAAL